MEKNQEIWYEPHPVSAERKAELRGQGYRIVDAVFAPADHPQAIQHPADGSMSPAITSDGSREKLPPVHGEPMAWANTPDGKHVLLGDMTKEELHALAKQYNVDLHHMAGVAKSIQALQSAFAVKD